MTEETEPTFVLTPRRASLDDLRWAERADMLELETLPRLRTTAERWTATLGAILGLTGSIFALKGRDDVSALTSGGQALVGVLLLVAFVLGVAGTFLAARAAQGTPRKVAWPNGAKLRRWELEEALLAQRCLRASRILALATVVLVAGAVAVTWFGDRDAAAADPSTLLVLRDDGDPLCGTLVAKTPRGLRITRAGHRPVLQHAGDVRTIVPLERCPGEPAGR
jgi:hypothetical protein